MADQPAWMAGEGFDTPMDTATDRNSSAIRYWMKQGEDKKVIFLTDAQKAKAIWEHRVKLGTGKKAWQNWFTCLAPTGKPCPLCEWHDKFDEYRRTMSLFLTIVDTTSFVDYAGKTRSNVKRLFVANKTATALLRRRIDKLTEQGQNLRGAMFDIHRSKIDKSCSVGDDFEYVKHVDLDSLPDADEFDYAELLKPDPEKVAACIEQLKLERNAVAKPDEEDISFG